MADRPEVFLTDDLSIAIEGYREVVVESQLHDQGDAASLARFILSRHTLPDWAMPQVLVLVEKLTKPEFDALMALEVSDEIFLPVTQEPDHPNGYTAWAVEGWTEEWTPSGYRVTLAVSDRNQLNFVSGWSNGWTDIWEVEQ